MESGVATRPIRDIEAYRDSLDEFVYHFGLIMKPVFSQAKQAPRRIVFAEGEDDRVLRAVQVIVDEGIARPILIGHPGEIARKLEAATCAFSPGIDFEVIVCAGQQRVLSTIISSLLARVSTADGA
jgi:malate dehydrogenase (oxaloacetate-decarboxylating)(NADP+)